MRCAQGNRGCSGAAARHSARGRPAPAGDDLAACPGEGPMGLWCPPPEPPPGHRLPFAPTEPRHGAPADAAGSQACSQPSYPSEPWHRGTWPGCFPGLELAPRVLLCFVSPQEKSRMTVSLPVPSPRFPSHGSQARELRHCTPRPLPPSPLLPLSLLWSIEYPSH